MLLSECHGTPIKFDEEDYTICLECNQITKVFSRGMSEIEIKKLKEKYPDMDE